jgi:hypothetical protein
LPHIVSPVPVDTVELAVVEADDDTDELWLELLEDECELDAVVVVDAEPPVPPEPVLVDPVSSAAVAQPTARKERAAPVRARLSTLRIEASLSKKQICVCL